MRLLALDTATEACSVALCGDGRTAQRWLEAPREHGERLLGLIDEVLAEAGIAPRDLDALAFGCGPGAFTGVRMGTGVVQGVAYGLDRPVVRVSTLAALAQGAYRRYGTCRWLPAIDARMGEVYWGMYMIDRDGLAVAAADECVVAPEQVPLPEGTGWSGTGSGWARYPEALAERLGGQLACDHGFALPAAVDMLPLAEAAWWRGEAVSPAAALPTYLRDRVAAPPSAKR